jgi:hypothetical protein
MFTLSYRPKNSHKNRMLDPRFPRRIGKVFALLAATLMLPSLASSQLTPTPVTKPPRLPEVNVVWVLIPVAGAALLFSARQFARRKASHASSMRQ